MEIGGDAAVATMRFSIVTAISNALRVSGTLRIISIPPDIFISYKISG